MFLQRDFASAQAYFATAIKEEPLNHSLWNKYGAACAQLLQTEESIKAYKLAIDLRPNYVRTIVNLGLSHNNMANFKAGANCFLNALVLQPDLSHVRTYLQTAFIQSKRFDLVEKLKNAKDMSVFRDEFELLDPANMQQQSLDELYAHPIFHQWEVSCQSNAFSEVALYFVDRFCFPKLDFCWKTFNLYHNNLKVKS